MSWCLNQGPSFDTQRHTFQKLNGFYQRFELSQDSPMMTPGKPQPRLKAETMKGTTKLKASKRPGGAGKQVVYSDSIPKNQPEPIYSGYANTRNKVTKAIRKSGRKLKVRRLI